MQEFFVIVSAHICNLCVRERSHSESFAGVRAVTEQLTDPHFRRTSARKRKQLRNGFNLAAQVTQADDAIRMLPSCSARATQASREEIPLELLHKQEEASVEAVSVDTVDAMPMFEGPLALN